MSLRIRLATPDDAAAVHAIYAPIVRETPISFEWEPPSVAEIRTRIESTLGSGLPWLVGTGESVDPGGGAEGSGSGVVPGYAYAGRYREQRRAYHWSAEVSVYVAADARRAGVGRALYESLFAVLRLQGYRNAYAGAALPNDGSVALHRALGFEPIGVFREVGYKLGAWHDVSWWQLSLAGKSPDPEPPRPLEGIRRHERWEDALGAGLRGGAPPGCAHRDAR